MQNTPYADERHTIATYLSDVLALERHIKAPIDAQNASPDHQQSGAAAIIALIRKTTTAHIVALENALQDVGGSADSGLKSAWATLTGGIAAALNDVRATKVSKSLAAISYTMLHATATGLGDVKVAQLAKTHLDDITPIIVEISTAIPAIVLEELALDGQPVVVTAAQYTQQASRDAWSGKNTGV